MFLQGKNILITGGAGFIGNVLVHRVLEQGANVKVIDNLSKGEAKNLEDVLDKIKFVHADLMDSFVAKEHLAGMDYCFHFAAKIGGIGYFHKSPASSLRDNSILNFNLWEAARNTNTKMICLSSSMVFERTSEFPTSEKAVEISPPPLTGYGFSKLVNEYICRTYNEEYGIPFVICRPFNAYGPGETPGDYIGYAHVIPDIARKIYSGQFPLEILGDGSQIRSYTFVSDIVDGILFVAEKAKNDDFNVSGSEPVSVKELCQKIWNTIGKSGELKFKHLPSFKYDVMKRIPDNSKIRKLGWEPKVKLEDGLKKTIDWLVANKKL